MANSSEAVKEAIAMQAEAVEDVEAAEVEQKRGASSVSIDLLIDAVRKEREGLDKLEEGIEVLRSSLEERRHALDRHGKRPVRQQADVILFRGQDDLRPGCLRFRDDAVHVVP